jgi:pyruvate dehydrogenase E2 component (dihydrolipoamide acetyltransferase)
MSAITPIVMPKWGLSMQEGTVNAWLVDEGAQIRVGEAILEVETDKISGEMEAVDSGTLRRKIAMPGQTLPVKALLGVLAEADVSDEDIDAFVASYVVPPVDDDEAGNGAPYQFTEVAGLRVRYARLGTGERTVMFVHGFGGDLDNWLFNIDALTEGNTVIAFDLPGHGQSTVKLPGATLGDLTQFVARFMDALEVQSAHFVGHSMGGAIAAQMALEHAAKVDSVTLIGAAGLGEEINAGYTEGFVAAESRRDLKPVIEQLFANPALVTRQLLDDVLKYKRLDGVGALLAELGGNLFGGGTQSAQPGRRLGETDKRVIVIWGADDRIIPARHAANAPRSATVKVIEGAGHMVQMEKASEVNSLLKQHITG